MTELGRPIAGVDTASLATLATSSIALILRLQDGSGAYPASPTFSAYAGYSWFRDGAFIADAMSAAGEVESAHRFFDWCSRILVARASQVGDIVHRSDTDNPVPDREMLATRFTYAGDGGDDEWWDFQLDGYGTWLWAVAAHVGRHGRTATEWLPAIELGVDYLISSWRRPCYDWWEERPEEVHVSTLGCIAAGLTAVAGLLDDVRLRAALSAVEEIRALVLEQGVLEGHLTKWIGADDVDASLLAVIHPLAVFPATGPVGAATIDAVDFQLNHDGGVHRYLRDTFYGGGQWPLLSCMLGLALKAAGEHDRALDHLRWAAATATVEGHLPEQVATHLLAPECEAEWVERWGTVATPLLWSHAMFVRLAVELEIV